MAVYKVIQDIEAEDKIVGFLTLKTFVYALICGTLLYINIRMLLASILGPLRYVFVFILFWPMALFGTLAAPIGREQSTEVWILSRVRFYLKPRLRIWNQSGLLELVTITAPKRIERQLTKNFTQREVRSRLKALATTLDSRGWAVRNVAVDLNANPSYLDIVEPESDRLVAGSNLPTTQAATDVTESDDIMDAQNNPTAQHFEALMQEEDARRKKQVSQIISNQQTQGQDKEEPEPPADYGFLDKVKSPDKKETTNFVSHTIVAPGTVTSGDIDNQTAQNDPELAAAERAYLEKERKKAEEVHAKSAGFKPKTRIETKMEPETKQNQPEIGQPKKASVSMTGAAQTAKLEELAQSGSAFSVATVQQLANRDSEKVREIGENEVEIDLHSH
jgi:hypothetical protein